MINFRRGGSIKVSLLLLFLCALITACGGSPIAEDDFFDPAEIVVIDSAYLESTKAINDPSTTTTSTHPPVAYPIQVEDEIEIRVGEMFGYESFNWSSLFTWNFEISQPEIVDGEETVCAIVADDIFSVLGISPGSCSVKYPSRNGGVEGFIFLTVKVVDG